mgnify:CR=1 FL=1
MGALVIGVVAGAVCVWGVNGLKRLLRADDALDVFGVHGVGGIIGASLFVGSGNVVRAVGPVSARASAGWVALAGCALGFAFLTKMLQAFLIVPGLALMFLVAAPAAGMWKRLGTLLIGAVTMIASSGWYIALVALWPADSRPYIAGSTDNSLLQLAFGYNGLQRILGQEGHGPGGAGGGPSFGHGPGGGPNLMFGGDPGIGRMFGMSMGTEVSWLLPAALIGLVAALWLTRRAPRTSAQRAGLLMWGGWMLVTGLRERTEAGIDQVLAINKETAKRANFAVHSDLYHEQIRDFMGPASQLIAAWEGDEVVVCGRRAPVLSFRRGSAGRTGGPP